jgi:hypothetical protein
MLFDIFLTKEGNIVPPLSDERFVMSVAFVQDSTIYVTQLSTKLDGKCKLSLAIFYSITLCEAKRYHLDKRINKRELNVVNLPRVLLLYQKVDTHCRTNSLTSRNTYRVNFFRGFNISYMKKNELKFLKILLLLALVRCQCT